MSTSRQEGRGLEGYSAESTGEKKEKIVQLMRCSVGTAGGGNFG